MDLLHPRNWYHYIISPFWSGTKENKLLLVDMNRPLADHYNR